MAGPFNFTTKYKNLGQAGAKMSLKHQVENTFAQKQLGACGTFNYQYVSSALLAIYRPTATVQFSP